MPTYEILTTEVVLTKYRIEAETEELAMANIEPRHIVNQGVLSPDIESIEEVEG